MNTITTRQSANRVGRRQPDQQAARPSASPSRSINGWGQFRPIGKRLNRMAQAAAEQVRANPFATAAGAAAVSAGLALLLPSTRREAEVMGEVAGKLGDVAREAADSAVEAGRNQVEHLAQAALASVGGAVVQAVAPEDRRA